MRNKSTDVLKVSCVGICPHCKSEIVFYFHPHCVENFNFNCPICNVKIMLNRFCWSFECEEEGENGD